MDNGFSETLITLIVKRFYLCLVITFIKYEFFLQVILDMNSIGESTNWAPVPPVMSMYKALGVRITPLPAVELEALSQSLQFSNRAEVTQVFGLLKPAQMCSFKSTGKEVQTLYHGTSPANLIGVLSR